MEKSLSQNLIKKKIIIKKGDAYITSKLYKYIPSNKNYEINYKKIPYIKSKFIRASL